MGTNYSTAANPTNDVEDVVVFLKFFKRPWAFNEASPSITQLPELVVAPEEESSKIKSRKRMPSSTAQMIDLQRLLIRVSAVIKLRNIRH